MEERTLAEEITRFLAPFLPYLLKGAKLAGQEAAKKVGEQFSEESLSQAKSLWKKLRRRERVKTAAQAAIALPENQATPAVLAEEIARALREDDHLRHEATQVLSKVKTGDVKKGGRVTGGTYKRLTGGTLIESEVETGDVYGEVSGPELEQ